jgi:2,3-bisphosphoglycerate-dependent phosphoglycerate mutase
VVLIRHAQSEWNRENRFTGWADPALTEAGRVEAARAGYCLARHGFDFDVAWSSRLQRADATLDILLDRLDLQSIPRYRDWRLNERHYGRLQGLDKSQAAAQYGEHQVWRWRRGYRDQAMPMSSDDPDHPRHDPRYLDVPPEQLPGVENLADTRRRVTAFWREQVVPSMQRGERVLISAHGNTLRALIMELSDMSVAEVEAFEIPTAMPIVYYFDEQARPRYWHYLQACDPLARIA